VALDDLGGGIPNELGVIVGILIEGSQFAIFDFALDDTVGGDFGRASEEELVECMLDVF
jgi:hypothetical protein